MTTPAVRVLYIDDDAGLRRLVQRDLQRHGYEVETAPDGRTGVARVVQGGIDVVALDQHMPEQDGLKTLADIRALPDSPPVVFVTGSQDSKVAVTALKAGAADYVIKEAGGEFMTLLRVAIDSAVEARNLRLGREAAEAAVREARDRFEALAAERAMLLREVNHRVGNSLQLIVSLLHMQAMTAELPETKSVLAAATSRVSAVAQVHRRLYTSDDVQSVALDQYLEALLEDLRRSANEEPGRSQLTLQADPVQIHPDRAVAVGMLVTELVINAMKYAYPDGEGPIRVRLRRSGPEVTLTVEDDGVGPPEAVAEAGLGQRIIRAMANKLGALPERDPAHPGTRIVLSFKTDAADQAAEPQPQPA